MDFGKTLLSKYGWEEGKGLGKEENGITTAIKPKLKFDNAGLGHNRAETFTHFWWEHAFNDAAKNIDVCETEDGISLRAAEQFDVSAKRVSSKSKKNLVFNNFLKSATTLTNEGIEVTVEEDCKETNTPSPTNTTMYATGPSMTDQELFNACGGRTAHKGARHGLGLNGKLARVEEQERKALAMISTAPVVKAIIKKKSKKTSQDEADAVNEVAEKRKKKKCKEVTDDLLDNNTMPGDTKEKHEKDKKKEGTSDECQVDVALEASDVENSPKKRKKNKKKTVISSDSETAVALETIPDTDEAMLDDTSKIQKKIKVRSSPANCGTAMSVEACIDPEMRLEAHKKKKSKSGRPIDDDEDNTTTLDDTKQKRKKSKKTPPSSDPENVACLSLETTEMVDIPEKRKKNKSTAGTEDLQDDATLEDAGGKQRKSKKVQATSSDPETVETCEVGAAEASSEKRKKKKSTTSTEDLQDDATLEDAGGKQRKSKKIQATSSDPETVETCEPEASLEKRKKKKSTTGTEDFQDGATLEDTGGMQRKSKKIQATSSDPETVETCEVEASSEKRKKKKKRKCSDVEDGETDNVVLVENNKDSINPGIDASSTPVVKKPKKSKRKHDETL